jgi:hypothetical protein
MRKQKAIFEEFIKNYLYKAESFALVLLLLIRLRVINVGQFPVYALYCDNTQNKASTCCSIVLRKGCE